MEVVVLREQPAILHVLVRPADLLADEPAEVPEQMGIVAVVLLAFLEELDAAADEGVAIAVVVELDRHVVGQIPGLELPERDEVRLQLGELLERGGEVGPVFGLLVVVGLFPQQVHRDAAQAERGQLHRFAGRVDFAEAGLAERMLGIVAQASQLAAFVVRLEAGELNSASGNSSTAIAMP